MLPSRSRASSPRPDCSRQPTSLRKHSSRRPIHFTGRPRSSRRPQRQAVLRIQDVLDAEAAADVRHLHGDPLRRDAEHVFGHRLANAVRLADGSVQDHAVAGRLADAASGFEGNAGDAVAGAVDAHDMRRAGKGFLDRFRVSHPDGEREIAGRLRPQGCLSAGLRAGSRRRRALRSRHRSVRPHRAPRSRRRRRPWRRFRPRSVRRKRP